MSKKLLIILLIFAAGQSLNAQVVYWNGLGRALVTNERLKGIAEDANKKNPNGTGRDSLNARKGTGGYTIFDLGVNAQPNEGLRASAILRIKNEFGGFYGDGSTLIFRQLRLDGVLNKFLKYEIGDIDMGLTPYTIYNFDESYHDYEADVFSNRRSVVHYENFNYGNKWRVQGFNAAANLKFAKGIEKIGIRGFATRNRSALFSKYPDRLMMGGRLDLVQSKVFQIGGNYITMFDIYQTQITQLANFNNKVLTGDFKLNLENEKIGVALFGELGNSTLKYDTTGSFDAGGGIITNSIHQKGYFYDLGASAKIKPIGFKLTASYRSVQPNFSSPAAQTRRINDYGVYTTANTPTTSQGVAPNASYTTNALDYRSQAIFPTVGNNSNSLTRLPSILDRFSQENLRNLSIQPLLMSFLPQYNNITPYGIATPNRQGITLAAALGEEEKAFKGDVTVDLLSEVQGDKIIANGNKRKFTGIRGGFVLSIGKLLKWEKIITLNAGIRHEHTTRAGDTSGVGSGINFTSNLIDAGLTAEIVKNFDLLAGYKLLSAKGVEYISILNSLNGNLPVALQQSRYAINQNQGVFAFGFRYRFTKNTYFTAQGHFMSFVNNKNNFGEKPSKNPAAFPQNGNYKINQLFLNYTMVF
jgi:hypothetical protein